MNKLIKFAAIVCCVGTFCFQTSCSDNDDANVSSTYYGSLALKSWGDSTKVGAELSKIAATLCIWVLDTPVMYSRLLLTYIS